MAIITWKNSDNGKILPAGSFEYELTRGFEPGRGEMILGSREFKQIEGSGEISIRTEFDGELEPVIFIFSELIITDYTSKTDVNGKTVYTVNLSDRRLKWKKFGEITLQANCYLSDGKPDNTTTMNGKLYSWKELVLLCIEAMGESDNLTNPDAIPENPYLPRNVHWVGKNASESLKELLQSAGYCVALQHDGKLDIVKRGESVPRTMPSGYGPVRKTGKLFHVPPDAVQVIGAPVINEEKIFLEPCALDLDGEVKALTNVSYLQGLDIGRELATEFCSLASNRKAQAAARLSVGHYFRIPKTGFYVDEHEQSNRQLVPILLSEKLDAFPELEGAWFERGDKEKYLNSGGPDNLKSFTKGFSIIDVGRGLVFTSRLCGILNDTEINALPETPASGVLRIDIVEPRLTFNHFMREPEGGLKYWRYTEGDPGGAIETIRRPDFQLFCYEGVPDSSILTDISARAKELALVCLSRGSYTNVECGIYAGAHPLKLDGILQYINWVADNSSARTAYRYGSPIPLIQNLPDNYLEEMKGLYSQVPCLSQRSELKLVNINKHGPIVIRSSDKRRKRLAQDNRLDDTEDKLFAELDDFDKTYQEPKLSKLAPTERENWHFREHASSPNSKPDSQDNVWSIQLISDDKYEIETCVNRSTEVIRLCDTNRGDLDDIWRVRSIPSTQDVEDDMEQRDDPTRVKLISINQDYRVMWLINTSIGGEGGWITDVPPEGLGLSTYSDEMKISPPKRIGQIGNIVILTDDDEITQTRDGDLFTYANIRHDAHFHKSASKDGRIYFTNTQPGTRPNAGTFIIGEMVNDPILKNIESNLGKESGQWCPQLRIPYLDGFSDSTVPSYFSQGGAS